jgi:tetratricopeptide (TPR) repeat protein
LITGSGGLENPSPPLIFCDRVGNVQSVKSQTPVKRHRQPFTPPNFWTGVLVISAFVTASVCQAKTISATKPAVSAGKPEPNQAEAELAKRLSAAQAARASGDPNAVALANRRLIALVETAGQQAAELYKRSISFEDRPDTHVDLAIADLQFNQAEEAIAECQRALRVEPNDPRAYNALGRAWAAKHDYKKAAEGLDRANQRAPNIDTLYTQGIYLLQSNDPVEKKKAAAVFQRMEKLAGDSGSLHVLFGRAYRDADDIPTAVREFQRAVAIDTRTPHAHYFLALAHLAVNEWKATPEIKAEFARELDLNPKDYLANYMLGFIASGERQYQSSDRFLKVSIEANPTWPEPWLYLGLNAYAQNDVKSAETMFRKAIDLTGADESRSNYQIRRAYVDLGRILINSDRKQEAQTYLDKARDLQNKTMQQGQQNVSEMALAGGAGSAAAIVPLNPQNESEAAPLTSGPADAFARVDASVVARAQLTPQQRLAADSQESRLRSVLALSFNDLATSEAVQKDYVTALGHYQEAERWDGNTAGLAKNLGLSAFRANNNQEAIRGLSRALKEQPDDGPVRAMLGVAYFGADKYPDAVATFTPLGTAGMRDSTVGYAWAASLSHIGELKPAGDVLTEFQKANTSTDALMLIGQLWIEVGDYARAVDTFHQALQSNPTLPKAHYFAGQAEIRAEHWPEAAQEFQAELKVQPGDVEATYNLGFVYVQESHVDDAVHLFQQVISLQPDHANAQYQLGKILLDRGQLAEAVQRLEDAARLSPQTDYIHYQLQAAYRKVGRGEDADRELAIYKELKAKQRATSSMQPADNR